MIEILSLSGSPVRESSTDHLLVRTAETLQDRLGGESVARVRLVRLNELVFIPCQACGFDPSPRFCVYHDDLDPVYDWLVEADCLLFGSPVYFDSVSAQAKSFIDRCSCFRPPDFERSNPEHPFHKRLDHKRPGAMILVGGERGWFEGARKVVAGWFKWVEVVNAGMIQYQSLDDLRAGGARDDARADDECERLATTLEKALRDRGSVHGA